MNIKSLIERRQLDTLVNREAKIITKIFGLLGVLFIIASLISLPIVESKFELNIMGVLYLIIMGLVSIAILAVILFILFKWFYYIKKNVWLNKTFEFSDEKIEIQINYGQLNFFNKWSYQRMVKRYGLNINQKLDKADITKTKIKQDKIQFYNKSNSLNPIVFPKEIENFEEIKSTVVNNPKDYKLKNTANNT